MRGESQLEVAVLILLTAEYYSEAGANSELIGEAAGCSPVVVRRLYKRLKEANLLDTRPGRYGLHLARPAKGISLLDIVEALRPLNAASVYGVEAPLSGTTPISGCLYDVLSMRLEESLAAAREQLGAVSLCDLVSSFADVTEEPLQVRHQNLEFYMEQMEKRYPKAK